MKLTLGKCFDMVTGLTKLLKTKLPGVAAFRLTKITKAIEAETIPAQEARMKIVTNHGVEIDQKEGRLMLPEFAEKHKKDPDKIKAFWDEWNELMLTEVKLDIKKLNVKCLESIEIESEVLMPLEDLFFEEEVKEK